MTAETTMRYFRVKNFEQFQHYKDRNPPWIKLHAALLNDYEFSQLPDDAKYHLLAIGILASQMGNRIPFDSKFIAQKIGARKPPDLKLLSQAGWLIEEPRPDPEAEGETTAQSPDPPEQNASAALADCKPPASNVLALARSREERRGETEERRARAAARDPLPNEGHRELAKRFGIDCAYEWEKFNDHEWKGRAPKDLNRAFRNWIRKAHDYAVRDGKHSNGGSLDWGKVV